MKLNAVGVTSKDLTKSVHFYSMLGFQFPELTADTHHIETLISTGSVKLMIDEEQIIEGILGYKPQPANHSSFAIEYESALEVDQIAEKLQISGYTIVKAPWNADWGQRYAIVQDPDGYMIDLYAGL